MKDMETIGIPQMVVIGAPMGGGTGSGGGSGTGGAVDSVNGQTGEVVLDAEDVGAASAEDLQDVADDVATLQAAYAGLTQSDIVPLASLPASGEANTIYRIAGTDSYSDYMWDGSDFVLMATYDNAMFSTYWAYLLKKILRNGVYTVDVQQDVNDLIDYIENGSGGITVVSPSISVDGNEISLVNEDIDSNASMYYTLDGSTPSDESTQYEEPFLVQYDSTIKAIAYNNNDEESRVSVLDHKAAPVEFITFEDTEVLEPLVLSLYDMDNDGKLSAGEAAAVTQIDDGVGGSSFKNTAITSFEELAFFEGITSIGHQAFKDCTSLKTIRVPKNVTKIDNAAFTGCTNLEMIYLPDGITNMCSCFGTSSGAVNAKLKIAGKKLPSSLNSFSGYYADNLTFRGCAELELDELPPHFPRLSPYAFYGCSKLALTSLPNEIASIGNYAFDGCIKLAITEIPASVSGTIGTSTFQGCTSLVSLNIKGSITGVTGDNAFWGCSNLEEIIFPETMTTWSSKFTFNSCPKLTKIVLKSPSVVALSRTNNDTIGSNSNIYVPSSLVSSYLADSTWSTITNASNRIKAIEE